MDLSDLYKSMSLKAKEIQKAWKPEIGDYIWRKYTIFGDEIDKKFWNNDKLFEVNILHYKSDVEGFYHATTPDGDQRLFKSDDEMYKKTTILLPRQDQLQGMLVMQPVEIIKYLFQVVIYGYEDYYKQFETTEQILLASVMKEKYNKFWNKEKEKWEKK